MGYDMSRIGDADGPGSFYRNMAGMTHLLRALVDVDAVVLGYDAPRELLDEDKDAWLRWAPEVPAISAHKFHSNDGWVVSRVECAAALHAIRQYEGTLPEGLTVKYSFDDCSFVEWLETCARADGFEVW